MRFSSAYAYSRICAKSAWTAYSAYAWPTLPTDSKEHASKLIGLPATLQSIAQWTNESAAVEGIRGSGAHELLSTCKSSLFQKGPKFIYDLVQKSKGKQKPASEKSSSFFLVLGLCQTSAREKEKHLDWHRATITFVVSCILSLFCTKVKQRRLRTWVRSKTISHHCTWQWKELLSYLLKGMCVREAFWFRTFCGVLRGGNRNVIHIWVRFPRTGICAFFLKKSRAFVRPNLIIFVWSFICFCPSKSLTP